MKVWVQILIAVLIGLLSAGILILVNGQPRGESITLRPAPTASPIIVYVSGAVKKSGVYSLAEGTRVEDAIVIAGGFLENAYVYNLNLAALLDDGDKISVSFLADQDEAISEKSLTIQEPAQLEIVFPINLNTANQLELEALPVIGPSKAQDILTYRESHGPFTSIEQVQNVYGIGPSTFEQIKELIYVN